MAEWFCWRIPPLATQRSTPKVCRWRWCCWCISSTIYRDFSLFLDSSYFFTWIPLKFVMKHPATLIFSVDHSDTLEIWKCIPNNNTVFERNHTLSRHCWLLSIGQISNLEFLKREATSECETPIPFHEILGLEAFSKRGHTNYSVLPTIAGPKKPNQLDSIISIWVFPKIGGAPNHEF